MAKFLVIDDDSSVRLSSSRILEAQGHDVTAVGDCRSGAAAIGRTNPDVLILDRQLPDYDGMKLLHKLRKSPRTAQLPVILLTERETAKEGGEAKALGVVGYLAKPISSEDFDLPVKMALRVRGIAPMASRTSAREKKKQASRAPKLKGSVVVLEADADEFRTVSAVLQNARYHPRQVTVASTTRREITGDPPVMVILGHSFASTGERLIREITGYPGADKIPVIPVGNTAFPNAYANAFSMGLGQVVPGPVKPDDLNVALDRAWSKIMMRRKRDR